MLYMYYVLFSIYMIIVEREWKLKLKKERKFYKIVFVFFFLLFCFKKIYIKINYVIKEL